MPGMPIKGSKHRHNIRLIRSPECHPWLQCDAHPSILGVDWISPKKIYMDLNLSLPHFISSCNAHRNFSGMREVPSAAKLSRALTFCQNTSISILFEGICLRRWLDPSPSPTQMMEPTSLSPLPGIFPLRLSSLSLEALIHWSVALSFFRRFCELDLCIQLSRFHHQFF